MADHSGSFAGLAPGVFIRLPSESDWGVGQVQSVTGDRVTVNFEHRGKVTLILSNVEIEIIDPSAEDLR